MRKHEGRSFALPPSPPPRANLGNTGRKRWERPDVPRPEAPRPMPVSTPDPVAAEIEEPEDGDDVNAMDVLSIEARRDVLAGFGGGAS